MLGPFYDIDGTTEIIPLGYEESMEPLAQAMGTYAVTSAISDLNGKIIEVGDEEMTDYIQEDWNRVMIMDRDGPPYSPRGFLLATRAGAYSAGRIAEEVVLWSLFTGAAITGKRVTSVHYFWQAQDAGMVVRPKGVASDDLILVFEDGSLAAVESKACFRPTPYLKRSVPKIKRQLAATLQANTAIVCGLAAFVDLKNHTVQVDLIAP